MTSESAAEEEPRISYGVRVFAKSPEGFVVEVVADEADRPMDWLSRTTASLLRQKFAPVDPFPSPIFNIVPPPPEVVESNRGGPPGRQGPPPGRGGSGRPQGQQQRGPQGGGQQQRGGGGGGGRRVVYRGTLYEECPWCRGDIYDNRQRKEDGSWKGPFYACKERAPPEGNCGWAVWKTDGTYDE